MSKTSSRTGLLGSGLVTLALLVAVFLLTIAESHPLFFVGAALFLALTILAARLAAAARRAPRRSVSDASDDDTGNVPATHSFTSLAETVHGGRTPTS